ncbi:hypothetical protein DQ04_22191000, partial [Trypanosoma grayi]|uniref:hypothetical protein n=1 Tax=Trypanosoma grayi TaxID=71804 RepID=UPI0004F4A4D3
MTEAEGQDSAVADIPERNLGIEPEEETVCTDGRILSEQERTRKKRRESSSLRSVTSFTSVPDVDAREFVEGEVDLPEKPLERSGYGTLQPGENADVPEREVGGSPVEAQPKESILRQDGGGEPIEVVEVPEHELARQDGDKGQAKESLLGEDEATTAEAQLLPERDLGGEADEAEPKESILRQDGSGEPIEVVEVSERELSRLPAKVKVTGKEMTEAEGQDSAVADIPER